MLCECPDTHSSVAWTSGKRALASLGADNLRKGSRVYIEGRLQTRLWEGQDGQKRRATEVVANDVQFLEPRGAAGAGVGVAASPVDDLPGMAEDMPRDVDPDEIPF